MSGTVQTIAAGRGAQEIAASMEERIRTGVLRPGQRLPTVRGLASELGVSPATVAAAYHRLQRGGVVSSAGRGGTRVRDAPPIGVRPPAPLPQGVRDLRTGGPDPELLPRLTPLEHLASETSGTYGESPVSPDLAEVATQRLAADGIDTSHLAVVGGALDGVERVLGAWLHPGQCVAVEDPGYSAALDLIRALGFELLAMDVDDRGAGPRQLARALDRGAGAVLLTPRAQNPTGAAWDAGRAQELREVLSAHPDVLVIEDDHAGPAGGVPALTVTGGSPRWATIRSVSKWLGPDLRLAVLAGDATTVSRVAGRQSLGTGWVSHLLQRSVAELWGSDQTGRILEHAASTYARRRTALAEALGAEGLQPTGCSGLTTWLRLGGEHELVTALLAEGWAVSPGERFRINSAPGIRIAFAQLPEREAPELATAIGRCLARRPVRTG